ncbi:MAG: hypothetical protein IV086_06605 [Hyphomonadaceae bacterium]|nr:MAG: hypothetical protein FD160_1575 [Caulobacteraceae bacterium]MBT9445352.1 hypothetical protein [Hyphomonadaceae bacterium]TPW05278.1 MAG: hypothetical protein FD124_2248 [Alphaproteobacteria bacterium]
MGVKVIDEDGTLLFEFQVGLGKTLLSRLLRVAKFVGEAQEEIILNGNVSQFGIAIESAMQSEQGSIKPKGIDDAHERMVQSLWPRLLGTLTEAVLIGRIRWTSWSAHEKKSFLRDVLFAPIVVSEQTLDDAVEEFDWKTSRWRKSLEPKSDG